MAEVRRVQSRLWRSLAILTAAFVILSLVASSALPLLEPVGADVTAAEIKHTAFLPVVAWCGGWLVAFGHNLRTIWAFGCALAIVHVAVAFHLGHGWSHAAAREHTRAVGGYGEGVYVNYAFVLVWYADAVWALVAFDAYRRRPRWLNWGVHGFLAFVMFNAAAVFGSPEVRRAFALMFLMSLSFLLWAAWKRRRSIDDPPAG
jgi:hypothetical protein